MQSNIIWLSNTGLASINTGLASVNTGLASVNAWTPVQQEQKPTFIASDKFKGSIKGYIFHVGANGLGYYKDHYDPSKFNLTKIH